MSYSAESSELAIDCRGVTKEFADGSVRNLALRGVTLRVHPRELTLLMGPSGCGKTTLLSIIAGLLEPTLGEVRVLGRNIARIPYSQRPRFRLWNVGIVFQQLYLLPAFTAVENACVPLMIAGWPRRRALKRAAELLSELGMSNELAKLPSQLSAGQQQRVAIARAMINDPRLLICDEPTSALDNKMSTAIMGILREISRNADRAVIVVSHDQRTQSAADRLATMEDGRIVKVE